MAGCGTDHALNRRMRGSHAGARPNRSTQHLRYEIDHPRMQRSLWCHGDDHPLEQLDVIVIGERTVIDQGEVLLARDARGGGIGERRHAASVAPARRREKFFGGLRFTPQSGRRAAHPDPLTGIRGRRQWRCPCGSPLSSPPPSV